jgi:hypothetical protein
MRVQISSSAPYTPVTQMGECFRYKEEVTGSIPVWSTTLDKISIMWYNVYNGHVVVIVKHRTCTAKSRERYPACPPRALVA